MQKKITLLHGWGMNKHIWELVLPELEAMTGCEVTAINLPGFGGEPVLEKQSLDTITAHIAEQLDPNSIIIGWSLGGLCAINLAARYPEYVERIILVASTPFFAEQSDWPGIKETVLNNFVKQLELNWQKTIERFLAIQAMGSEHAKSDIKAIKRLLEQAPEPDPYALDSGLRILKQEDLREQFRQLKQPISGIFGRLDALVPNQVIEELKLINPGFKAHILTKSSHAPFISHREEFLGTLKLLLDQ